MYFIPQSNITTKLATLHLTGRALFEIEVDGLNRTLRLLGQNFTDLGVQFLPIVLQWVIHIGNRTWVMAFGG